jgi:hypothetical protein
MEQAVEGVEEDFPIGFEAVRPGMIAGDGGADEDFAVGKGDDVGLGGIAEEVAVDAGDGGAIDEDDVNRGEVRREGAGKQREGGLKPPQKRTDPDRRFALPV